MKYSVILLILVGFSSLTIYVGSAQTSHAITLGMSSEQILETQKLILLGHVDSVDTMQDRSEYTVSVLEYVKSSDTFEKNNVIKLVGCAEGQRGGCVTFEKGQDVLFVLDEKNGVLQVSELSFVSPNPRCTVDDLFALHDARYGLEASQNNQTKKFFTGQPIDITFYAYNKQLDDSTYTVTVEFFRANNNTVFSKTFEGKFEECIPNVKLDTAFTPADMGRYGKRYTASYGGGEMSYGFPIVEKGATPLKQQSSGIPSNHILCNESLVLVQKYDDSPACVTEQTKQKLIERGWSGTNITEIKNNFENNPTTQMVVDPVDEFYFSGDEIVIRGSVWDSEKTDLQKIPVQVQIHFGDELVDIAQAQLSDDGIFSHSVMASGPVWKQSGIYTITASYDSGTTAQNRFGFSSYYEDHSEMYFANSDADDYEDLCGYPVTHEMRRDFIESMKHADDRVPLVELNQATFTHVERSLYLTDMPRLQYWYDIKDGRQMYFIVEACVSDDFNVESFGYPGPNYQEPQDIVIDGVYHKILPAPGYPLIYADSRLPVLDIDNCKRVADNYTKKERQELYTREHAGPEASLDYQVFLLMDYCAGVGSFEMTTVDGKINWVFTGFEK